MQNNQSINNEIKEDNDKKKNIQYHPNYIKDFINLFSIKNFTMDKTVKLNSFSRLIKEDINKGNRN